MFQIHKFFTFDFPLCQKYEETDNFFNKSISNYINM